MGAGDAAGLGAVWGKGGLRASRGGSGCVFRPGHASQPFSCDTHTGTHATTASLSTRTTRTVPLKVEPARRSHAGPPSRCGRAGLPVVFEGRLGTQSQGVARRGARAGRRVRVARWTNARVRNDDERVRAASETTTPTTTTERGARLARHPASLPPLAFDPGCQVRCAFRHLPLASHAGVHPQCASPRRLHEHTAPASAHPPFPLPLRSSSPTSRSSLHPSQQCAPPRSLAGAPPRPQCGRRRAVPRAARSVRRAPPRRPPPPPCATSA